MLLVWQRGIEKLEKNSIDNKINNDIKDNKNRFDTQMSMLKFFLKGSIGYFGLGIFFTLALSFVELINPRIIGYTIDGLISNPNVFKGRLIFVAVFVIIVALIGGLCRYLNGLFNAKGAEILVKNMRDSLFSHILYLPYVWHGENKTGDIIQRCTSDVDTVKRFLSEELMTLLRTFIMIILSVGFMCMVSVKLTLVAAVFIPVIIGYSLIFHKKIGSAFLKVDTEEGVLSTIAQENLTGVRVVRAFGREAYERERFHKQNEEYTGMWVHMMRILAEFWGSLDLIAGLQILLILSLGAYLCVNKEITAGGYVSFVSYNAMLTWPVRELGRVIADMSKAGVSVDRIRYIMNSLAEEDAKDAVDFPSDCDIKFNNVTFGFDKEQEPVLKDINIEIKKGETIGILGKTGSGKSTLVQLLDRLYSLPDDQGTITIGDIDIRDMKASLLRKNVGLVLQEPFLFSRTLGENIAMGIDEKDSDKLNRIEEAIGTAHLKNAISKFKEGLNTPVGERGVTLSGGQKQRTAIASVMIRKTPILIFDDSLSAIDTKTDEAIRKSVKENTTDTTVILISHRITTLMMADRIFVMDNGRIVESGCHAELIEKQGLYKKIFDLQSQGMSEE